MPNPWLEIPLADYEGHMDSVQQLSALSDMFADVLSRCQPASVAVLGVAGGNGLERIDRSVTKRVVGLDLNPDYLAAIHQRGLGVELHCVDLSSGRVAVEPVDLVHAALVFEHAGTGQCLDNALALVAPGGSLSVVLQLATEPSQNIASTPFASMQSLKSVFAVVDRVWLQETLARRGLRLNYETEYTLPDDKRFWLGIFR